ncbi:MAG: hypothetical protein AAF840_04260 [Bacteroidota bacterium]
MKPLFVVLCLFLYACGGEAPPSPPDLAAEAPKTPPSEVETPTAEAVAIDNPYRISNGIFLGMRPGGKLEAFADGLRADVLQTGEGDFDVFYIDGAEGNELGYLMADPNDESLIGSISITAEEVVTEEGISVGMTFAELEEKVGPVEVHGSEIEGYTYAYKYGLAYRLDVNFWSYEVDEAKIDPATKLLEILVSR